MSCVYTPGSTMSPETLAVLIQEFGITAVAADEVCALFDPIESGGIEAVQRAAKTLQKPIAIRLHGAGDVVTMHDGREYMVGDDGAWRRIHKSIGAAAVKPLTRPAPTPIEHAVPRDHKGPLTRDQLTAAVRHEIRGMIDISEDDMAWIVEATLTQLGYGLLHCGSADLGYTGAITSAQALRSPSSLAAPWYVFSPFVGGSEHDDDA